ncbi:MAG: CHRD domain-containing protein [Actinobacteria bacterium]|nr:CHRD domain-containing protein [Actinomycetota bacterium]
MNNSKTAFFAILFVLAGITTADASTSPTVVHRLSVSATGSKMPMGSDGMMTGAMNGVANGAFVMNSKLGYLCYSIMTKHLTSITEAHIQVTSSERDVVLFRVAKLDMMSKSCMKVAPKILTDMLAHPGRYSLMVHTKSFPDGAVMGSLRLA